MRKLLEKIHTGNLFALLWNLLIVYVAYSLCRLMFYLLNLPTYSDISGGHVLDLFGAGLIFDTSAIVYTNAILIIMFLLPLHWKENGIYYKVARWYYTIVNSFCISTNLIDCVYYQYTGKRTTMSVLNEFSNEGFGNMANILGKQFLDNWYLVLLAVLIWWLFYKLFRSFPQTGLYVVQQVAPTDKQIPNQIIMFEINTDARFGQFGGISIVPNVCIDPCQADQCKNENQCQDNGGSGQNASFHFFLHRCSFIHLLKFLFYLWRKLFRRASRLR